MSSEKYMFILDRSDLQELIRQGVVHGLNEALKDIQLGGHSSEELITDIELCERLHITRQTSSTWRRDGKVPYRMISGRIYYVWSDVLAAMNQINNP